MGNISLKKLPSLLKLKKGKVPRLPSDYIQENILGEGIFGQVIRCRKVSTNETMAVKIISKDKGIAGREEIRVMRYLKRLDCDKHNLVKFYEGFEFNNSYCLAFESLHISLYDYMEEREFKPIPVSMIRVITQQLLVALGALKSLDLVHCDIKPDNIMLVSNSSMNVKLIDFGLVLWTPELKQGLVMQNPSYRALEVMLGLPFDGGVDMWSVGCVLAFLYTGYHLLPEDEEGAMRRIVDLFGKPDADLLNKGLYTDKFFTRVQTDPAVWELKPSKKQEKSKGWNCDRTFSTHLEVNDALAFIDLMKKMLALDPKMRITPAEALGHTFITMKHLSEEPDSRYFIQANKLMTASGLQSAIKPHDGTSDEPSLHSSKETFAETERKSSECENKVRAVVNPHTYIKSVRNEPAESTRLEKATTANIMKKPLSTSTIIHVKPCRPSSPTTNFTSESHQESAVSPNVDCSVSADHKSSRFSTDPIDKSTATATIKKPLSTSTIIHVKPLRPKSPSELSCSTSEKPPASFPNIEKAKTFTLQTCGSPAPPAIEVKVLSPCSQDSSCSSEKSGLSKIKPTKRNPRKKTWKRIKELFKRIRQHTSSF